jgi:RHS repeat-associated protein
LPIVTFGISAETLEQKYEYARRVQAAEAVGPLGTSLFGDQINYYNGSASFTQVDVSIPGNSGLPMQIARTWSTASPEGPTAPALFGEWELDIPVMRGVFARNYGWQVRTTTPNNRCSVSSASNVEPGTATNKTGAFGGAEYWRGNSLYVPGSGDQQLLYRSASYTKQPADGQTYRWVTSGHWQVRCHPTLASGQPGEGFVAVSPEGTKYTFDWMVSRPYSTIQRTQTLGGPGGGSVIHQLYRDEVRIYPTRIEDRFGNWLTYTYSGEKVTQISANDGRVIGLTYHPTHGTIQSVVSGGRTWQYEYSSSRRLIRVVQPDGSVWAFGVGGAPVLLLIYQTQQANSGCDALGDWNVGAKNFTMTHPSGAIGVFTFTPARHTRSNISPQQACHIVEGLYEYGPPRNSDNYALTEKSLSGPGLTAMSWNVTYATGCVTCESKVVSITNPDLSLTRHTFGTRYYLDEGKLLRTETLPNANAAAVRDEVVSYAVSPTNPSYAYQPGWTGMSYEDAFGGTRVVPEIVRTVTQGGATFNSRVNSFDSFARPLNTDKWSGGMATNFTRTDAVEYYDDTVRWVTGQIKRQVNVNTGLVESQTDYWPETALPQRTWRFGKPQQYFTYNADSTLATVTDGNNHTIALSDWHRGIPRNIRFPSTPEAPAGSTQLAAVSDNGWITSVTDENGYKTCYGYDAMGRVSLITYPSETAAGVCDNSAWTPTTITFTAAGNAAAYGMPAGHWRQTMLTGNGRKTLIFDALWRPVVEQTMDLGNVGGTLSEVIKRYDAAGRLEFQSYPMNTNGLANYADPTLTGVWTDYDALDRVTSVTQDSELGPLTTLTEYLTGFKTRTTPPKGAAWQTTTSYQAYDQPSYDMPVAITHPEGAFTDITRNVFGKPTTLKRRNSASSLAITRSYAYNANQELCRSVEPETGATLIGYDAAGNLKWSASGLPAATACETNGTSTAVAVRRADRTFDARNRVKSLSFPGGLGNTTYAYTPDGLPSSVVTDNGATDGQATINYAYNKRRLITREILITPQVNWPYDYGYNANGHLAVNNWHGLSIDYAPNALGQPTKAGTYASGVSYYPNGAIKQFIYGNGIVHTMAQNARQLPSRSTNSVTGSTPLDLGYAYDKHANVSGITDYLTGARQTRGMTYDNLDRLTQTTSSMFGMATYGYNVLDNLTTVNVAGGNKARNHAYVYDANSRLTNVTTGVGGPTVIGLGYDVQGNLANKSGVLYSFDYGNRLRMVTDPVAAKTSTYAYDGHGRRVKDLVNGVVKHSQYTQSGQLVMVGDERVNKVSEYVYLQGSLLAIRERDVPTAAYTTKYQHTDALGTPIATTSQSRTLLETSEYEPFGQQVNAVGAAKDGPGYTGHVMDAATGLTYMQQRYYDPGIGMMLSVDPVTAYSSGDMRHFNVYAYAYNNPYRFTDPDGRCPSCPRLVHNPGALVAQARAAQATEAAMDHAAPKSAFVQIEVGIKGGSPALGGNGQVAVGMLVSKNGVDTYVSRAANVGGPLTGAVSLIDGKPNDSSVLGGSAGLGASTGISSSENMSQFAGKSDEYNVSVGPVSGTASTSSSGNTLSIGVGKGPSASVSKQSVETIPIKPRNEK